MLIISHLFFGTIHVCKAYVMPAYYHMLRSNEIGLFHSIYKTTSSPGKFEINYYLTYQQRNGFEGKVAGVPWENGVFNLLC